MFHKACKVIQGEGVKQYSKNEWVKEHVLLPMKGSGIFVTSVVKDIQVLIN